ncbi:hypothetical protein EDB85DRAFT_1894579 [Lactarius pseudohatsudake]|nr:hypothetical protein EDB85DRAFT_1894579 [Lactarius pseudohatsudake]
MGIGMAGVERGEGGTCLRLALANVFVCRKLASGVENDEVVSWDGNGDAGVEREMMLSRVFDLRLRTSSCAEGSLELEAGPPGSNTRRGARGVSCPSRSRCAKVLDDLDVLKEPIRLLPMSSCLLQYLCAKVGRVVEALRSVETRAAVVMKTNAKLKRAGVCRSEPKEWKRQGRGASAGGLIDETSCSSHWAVVTCCGMRGTVGDTGDGVTSSWVETEPIILSPGGRCGGVKWGEMGVFSGASGDAGRKGTSSPDDDKDNSTWAISAADAGVESSSKGRSGSGVEISNKGETSIDKGEGWDASEQSGGGIVSPSDKDNDEGFSETGTTTSSTTVSDESPDDERRGHDE